MRGVLTATYRFLLSSRCLTLCRPTQKAHYFSLEQLRDCTREGFQPTIWSIV